VAAPLVATRKKYAPTPPSSTPIHFHRIPCRIFTIAVPPTGDMAKVNTVKQTEIILMPSALTYSAVTRESDTALGRWLGRWYFTAIGLLMIVVAVAGFAPSIIDSSERLAPLTPLVAVHGILLFCWLLLFVFQTVLIRSRQAAFHRRMGIVAVVLLALLVPLSYVVTVQMVHRGFDLSGDQGGRSLPGSRETIADPLFGSIFNFVTLIEFLVMAGIALAYRRRTEIHKRFMLFANISLMGAPIAHFLGYFGLLSASTGPFMVLGGFALFFLSAVAGDYFRARRVHPLTAALAILSFLLLPIQAIIGDSAAWHHFATWLAR
jgi:uncharacterized membrane protein YozB (DUF420 family)